MRDGKLAERRQTMGNDAFFISIQISEVGENFMKKIRKFQFEDRIRSNYQTEVISRLFHNVEMWLDLARLSLKPFFWG